MLELQNPTKSTTFRGFSRSPELGILMVIGGIMLLSYERVYIAFLLFAARPGNQSYPNYDFL